MKQISKAMLKAQTRHLQEVGAAEQAQRTARQLTQQELAVLVGLRWRPETFVDAATRAHPSSLPIIQDDMATLSRTLT